MVTIDDLVEHLQLSKKPEGIKLVELERMLQSAIERVEATFGPITPTAVTERVEAHRGRALLSSWPVLELTSVRIAPPVWAPATPTTVLVAGIDATGIVHCATPISATLLVELIAGRDPAPQSLSEAVLIIAGQLYESQRGAGPTAGRPGSEPTVVSAGFAVPRRASELMRPYMAPRIGVA